MSRHNGIYTLLGFRFCGWEKLKNMFVVELEKGVWIAPWIGDPGRTLKIENAKQYKQLNHAIYGLKMARKYRPFLKAKVRHIEDSAKANEA